jgi:hypothetical protein
MKRSKETILKDILSNSVYTEGSALYQNLKHALSALSYSQLMNLRLIINLKLTALENGSEKTKTTNNERIQQ